MCYFLILSILRPWIAKHSRPLHLILFGKEQNNYKLARCVLRLICGIFLAWLLWEFILANIPFSLKWRIWLLLGLVVFIAIGFVFSTSIKCVILLIIVGMTGKSGRGYLRAISLALLISGPIRNLCSNGQEAARVISCSAILQYNLTKTRFDLMTKPFQKTIIAMKDDFQEITRVFDGIKNITGPIRKEVEGDGIANDTYGDGVFINRQSRQPLDQAMEVQRNYRKKLENLCRLQLQRGENRCKRAFSNARERCMRKLPHIVNTLLCWPLRLDFVCNFKILGDPDKICDPSDALPTEFGEAYVSLKTIESQLVPDKSKFKVKYKLHNSEMPSNVIQMKKAAKMVMRDIKEKKDIFDHAITIMRYILMVLFFHVVISSLIYQCKYCSQIRYDNIYITKYFKHLDERRKQIGKQPLLPLKKFERKQLVDLDKWCSYSKDEAKAMLLNLLQFSMEVAASSFFLLLDHIIVTMMLSVRAHAQITYVQEGEHEIKFHINGTGLLAKMMRITLKNFNMHEKVHTTLSNEGCLPNPSILPMSFYIKLGLLYATIVMLIYKSYFFVRLRRWICSWFYRKIEKQRVLYLYNNLRRERRYLFEEMYKFAQSNIVNQRIRQEINMLLRLRLKHPKYFNWLKFFKAARRRCVICEALEDELFVVCGSSKCDAVYCDECWHDIKANCMACNKPIKSIRILNFHDFFEEFKPN